MSFNQDYDGIQPYLLSLCSWRVRQPSNGPFRFNGDVSPVTMLVCDWFLPIGERHSNRLLHRRHGDERKHHILLSLKKCVVLVYGGKDGHLYSFNRALRY